MADDSDVTREACRAVLEVGGRGATLRFERAADGDDLGAAPGDLVEAVEEGWIVEREGAYFLSKAGVDEVKAWLDRGVDASETTLEPDEIARIRPRFDGRCEGLFLDTHHTDENDGH